MHAQLLHLAEKFEISYKLSERQLGSLHSIIGLIPNFSSQISPASGNSVSPENVASEDRKQFNKFDRDRRLRMSMMIPSGQMLDSDGISLIPALLPSVRKKEKEQEGEDSRLSSEFFSRTLGSPKQDDFRDNSSEKGCLFRS